MEEMKQILIQFAPEREDEIVMSIRSKLQKICIEILHKRPTNQLPKPHVRRQVRPESEPEISLNMPLRQVARKSIPIPRKTTSRKTQFEVIAMYYGEMDDLTEELDTNASKYDISMMSPSMEEKGDRLMLLETFVSAYNKRDILDWLESVEGLIKVPEIKIHMGSPVI